MSEQQPRPGQATLAGALIIGGSVVVVLSAWQRISTLHTLKAQEEFQQMLGGQSFEGMSVTVDGLTTVIRVLCLIGAGAAAASTILGFQVFQRSISARIALTALSPLLLIGGLATASFLAPMVVAGIAMLWLQPTRDWYAGRPWIQRYEERRAQRLAALRSGSPTLPGGAGDKAARPDPFAPPASQPAPDAPAPPAAAEAPTQPGPTQPGPPQPGPPQPGPPQPGPGAPAAWPQRRRPDVVRRPGALTAVCVLAWVTSTLVVLGLALVALVVAGQSEELFAEMRRQQPDLVESSGLTERDMVASVYVVVGVLVVWSLVAVVLAGLAFIGHNWARITLAVSSICAGIAVLLFSLTAPPLVVLALVFAVSSWLLLRPDVAAWYRR